MENPTVAVVGAGILGAAAGYALSKRIGPAVTVIDKGAPGAATTATSMAWLNASNKTPREYFELNFAGLRENYAVAAELGDDSWIHPSGSIVSADYAEGLDARIDQLDEWGYRVDRVDGGAVLAALEPQLAFADPDELVARYPDEGWVDGQRAAETLLRAAVRGGAVFRQGAAVVGIAPRGGGGYALTLEDESVVTADVVVNAAGTAAARVAAMLGRRISLSGTRGLVLRLAGPPGLIGTMVLTKTCDVRADGEGFYRIHSDEVDEKLNRDGADRGDLVAELLARARRVLPALEEATVVTELSSVRPMPEDSYSSLGPVASLPGYYEMITHSGITFGPLFGRLISELVLDGESEPGLDAMFSPDRFSNHN